MRLPLYAAIDFVFIVIFVAIGRSNHDDGMSWSGMWSTAWPFLTGALIGWSLAYVAMHFFTDHRGGHRYQPNRVVPDGIIIWVATVAIGMVLRVEFHQGIAVSFVIVASIFLGVFLLGWRTAAIVLARRGARTA
jgi:hypothetical protein